MFDPLSSFISHFVREERPSNQFAHADCRLLTAALLIRIAGADNEMSEVRWEKLHAVLKSRFELDDLSTNKLIDQAAAAERAAIDLYYFTHRLNAALDDQGRCQIIRMMWEIIYVDGSASEFENNIIWRAADLLGVPSRQRIELRRRIADDSVKTGRSVT